MRWAEATLFLYGSPLFPDFSGFYFTPVLTSVQAWLDHKG